MAAEPSLLGARLLLSRYQSVSNAGRFANYDEPGNLLNLCRSLENDLPQHKKVVAEALSVFFETIQETFDELAEHRISWPILDAVILEAVNYVAKDANANDAPRIVSAVNSARRDWCGR